MTSNSQSGAPSPGGYGYNNPNLTSEPFSWNFRPTAVGISNVPSAPPPYSKYDANTGPPTQSAAPSVGVGDSRPNYTPATNPTVICAPRKHRQGHVSRMMGVVIRSARAPVTILRNTLSQPARPTMHQQQQPVPPPAPGIFYTGSSAAAPGGGGTFGGAGVPANNNVYLLTGAGMIECGAPARGGGGGGPAAAANSARTGREGGGVIKRVWVTKSSNIFSSLDFPTSVRFQDVLVRHAFVRNVYGILTVQMTLVCGVAAAFLFLDPIKTYTREHAQTISLSAVVLTCMTFLFGCICSEAWKYAPGKYTCLVVLTASLSLLFGALTSLYHSEIPMLVAGMAAVTTWTLVVCTCQSKIAFTRTSGMTAVLCVVSVVCSASAILASSLFGSMETVLNCVYAALAVLVLCVHQAYNLGLMVGGERDAPITMDQCIYVAIKLFLNLIFLPLDSIFILIDISDHVFGWRSPGVGRV